MNWQIQKAEEKDFPEIAKIYSDEFSKPPYNEPWTKEKSEYKIKIYSNYCDIFKIISNQEIIGFVVFNPNHWCPGEVVFGEEMAIKSEFQGKGMGTNVLNYLFDYYKERGFKKFMGIANLNGKAINLYERIGIQKSNENSIIEKNL